MRELASWSRRPWPSKGDDDEDKLYACIGRALSQWEKVEGHLAILFSAYISASDNIKARRSYVAVRTYQGRADMMKAASSAYYAGSPSADLQALHKSLIRECDELDSRRNDIAHGTVDYFLEEKWYLPEQDADDIIGLLADKSLALYPSWASFKDRDLNNKPTYCMSSTELAYFEAEFKKLIDPISHLVGQVLRSYSIS